MWAILFRRFCHKLEALSFLDKRKATKPKLVIDQVLSVLGAPPSSDQIIVPA
jgi:hypothetical protein